MLMQTAPAIWNADNGRSILCYGRRKQNHLVHESTLRAIALVFHYAPAGPTTFNGFHPQFPTLQNQLLMSESAGIVV